ncbi:MAG: hypothetical protein K0M69_09775 [Youngiibacter sp.]|nr:hypothetical protein [Youngiibacter sp.]
MEGEGFSQNVLIAYYREYASFLVCQYSEEIRAPYELMKIVYKRSGGQYEAVVFLQLLEQLASLKDPP